ncbi:uracil-DNA glycosylase family protein [Sphingomicrobium sediminis]|uniref:Uracil-DNA glycosylase-like domain-containing protein n=1 Tax=Sphingomicrobium sediminis TaxID=2950949 RepID=A0A9X2J310_9SPHN|nr:uracil-DNA glycosylase family protein [Sphingomicrobium sediminis]MCM8556826.1 hypothetical protein [Sphingomicrobium sediminis]
MNQGVGIDREAAAALLGWWRDAGVDVATRGDAPSWRSLAKKPVQDATPEPVPSPVAEAPLPAAPAAAPVATPQQPLPDTLDAIKQWHEARANELGAPLVPANLNENAPLLAVGGRAETANAAFEGEIGTLFNRMMAAIGVEAPSTLLIEPVLMPGTASQRTLPDDLVEVARRSIAGAKPQRLLIFGNQASQSLLGMPLAKARGQLHHFNSIPTVATLHPRWLIERPRDKRLAWEDMLILMGAQ